jgi:hypothetical protein
METAENKKRNICALGVSNLTGYPEISPPHGFDAKGQSASLWFTGKLFGEENLLLLAGRLSKQNGVSPEETEKTKVDVSVGILIQIQISRQARTLFQPETRTKNRFWNRQPAGRRARSTRATGRTAQAEKNMRCGSARPPS